MNILLHKLISILCEVKVEIESIPARENTNSDLAYWIEKNDIQSFRMLHDASSKHLLFYAYKIVKNKQIAEEVVQETFTSIWLQSTSYNADRGSPVTWMRTIVKNKALDALRTSKFYSNYEFVKDNKKEEESSNSLEPDAVLTEKQSSLLIMKYLRKLNGSQMEAIYLSYYKGLSHSEVASIVAEPLGTVKNRIRLGILSLRRRRSGLRAA